MKEIDWQLFRYFFLRVVLLFVVALSFYGSFRECEKQIESTCYKFFAIVSFALL